VTYTDRFTACLGLSIVLVRILEYYFYSSLNAFLVIFNVR